MSDCSISIIVPVYNAQEWLDHCLDSIASQDFESWQAILVDDGSKDNCGKICDEYAAMDSRFRVIHKENGGLSDARITTFTFPQSTFPPSTVSKYLALPRSK